MEMYRSSSPQDAEYKSENIEIRISAEFRAKVRRAARIGTVATGVTTGIFAAWIAGDAMIRAGVLVPVLVLATISAYCLRVVMHK